MSNLSVGSGVIVVFLITGSPDRVSALSSRATRARIRPVIRGHQLEGLANQSRFPAALLIRRSHVKVSVLGCVRITSSFRGLGRADSLRAGAQPYFGPR